MGYRPRRSSRKNNTTLRLSAIIVTLVIAIATGGVGFFGGCAQLAQLLPGALTQRFSNAASVSTLGDIPAYSGSATVYINANTAHPQGTPTFASEEISRAQSGAFTEFSRLDYLGRCGAALACLGQETLPTKPRESISHVYPSGWDQRSYEFIDEGRSLQSLPSGCFLPLRRKRQRVQPHHRNTSHECRRHGTSRRANRALH